MEQGATTVQERTKQLGDIIAIIVHLLAAALHTGLSKACDSLPPGIKSADREQQLAAIGKERRTLGLREQEFIGAAAMRRMLISQRADVDPVPLLNIKRDNGRVTYDLAKLKQLRAEFESLCAASSSKNRDIFGLKKRLEELQTRVKKLPDGNVEKKMLNDEIQEIARILSDHESAMADIEQRRGVLDQLVSRCDQVLQDELSR